MGSSAGGAGGGFTVVDGGPDDPFSAKGGGQSAIDDGQTAVRSSQDDAQDDDAGRGTGGAGDQGADAADDDAEETVEVDPDEYFNERLRAELPRIQSGWDRQNQALKAQLDQQRAEMENLQRSIREGQLSQLSPEDQAKLKSQWDAEDAQKEIDKKLKATDDFFFNTYAFNVLTRFAEFGVTEEELLACESVEDMDKLALERKADYYEAIASGKKPDEARRAVTVASGKAASAANGKSGTAGPAKKVPAGSSARTDLGGGGAPEQKQGLLNDQNLSSMAANVKSLFGKSGTFG